MLDVETQAQVPTSTRLPLWILIGPIVRDRATLSEQLSRVRDTKVQATLSG